MPEPPKLTISNNLAKNEKLTWPTRDAEAKFRKKLSSLLSNKSFAFRCSMSPNCISQTGGGDTFCLSLPNWPFHKFYFMFFRVFVRQKLNSEKRAQMHYVCGFFGAFFLLIDIFIEFLIFVFLQKNN